MTIVPRTGPVVGQLGLGEDVLVPLGEVGRLRGEDALAGHGAQDATAWARCPGAVELMAV